VGRGTTRRIDKLCSLAVHASASGGGSRAASCCTDRFTSTSSRPQLPLNPLVHPNLVQKYKICAAHASMPSLMVGGVQARFCQQASSCPSSCHVLL